jgi:hypothetical protein
MDRRSDICKHPRPTQDDSQRLVQLNHVSDPQLPHSRRIIISRSLCFQADPDFFFYWIFHNEVGSSEQSHRSIKAGQTLRDTTYNANEVLWMEAYATSQQREQTLATPLAFIFRRHSWCTGLRRGEGFCRNVSAVQFKSSCHLLASRGAVRRATLTTVSGDDTCR